MNKLIQCMLENRGCTHAILHEINDPTYGKLRNIDEMAARLRELYNTGAQITIFPDFDMDGIASGTAGFAGFAELGFSVNLFVPDPEKGYGISAEDIRELKFRFPETKAIVTCDTGIAAREAAAVCRELGLEFLVTDHHTQQDVLDAPVIVNPKAIGETYAHPSICGAFVLWQVMQRYADLYCNYFVQDQIRRLRVFAGIGTISDSMPVLYENRQLVKDAVAICRFIYGDGTTSSVASIKGSNTYRLAFWGLYNLMKTCEDNGIIKSVDDIDEDFFGFYLAPMFNSIKRMGGDLEKAFGVFFANESRACTEFLYDLNVQRKAMVKREFAAVKTREQPYAPYLFYSDAKEGVLGLIATKLMEETGAPVFVMNDRGPDSKEGARYHGSARCPDWYDGLSRCGNMIFAGGHSAAFGWGVLDTAGLEALFQFLSQDVLQVRSTVTVEAFKPDFVISTDWTRDSGIDTELFNGFLDEIVDYKPFGVGFPAPTGLFRFRNEDVLAWKQIGKAKEHLKICFANGFDILCWNQGAMIGEQDVSGWHHVIGTFGRSFFRGAMSVNFTGVLSAGVEGVS